MELHFIQKDDPLKRHSREGRAERKVAMKAGFERRT